jgi:hypothetical protein
MSDVADRQSARVPAPNGQSSPIPTCPGWGSLRRSGCCSTAAATSSYPSAPTGNMLSQFPAGSFLALLGWTRLGSPGIFGYSGG